MTDELQPTQTPSDPKEAEVAAEKKDNRTHRKLLFGLIGFFVILIGAGAAYAWLAPASVEGSNLVASPANATDERNARIESSIEDQGKNTDPHPGESTQNDAGSASASTNEPTNSSADTAPDITVFNTSGDEVTLSSQKGKPVVLNFWASWCGPCQSEMPDFEEAYKTYGDDVVFMMVNMTGMNGETVESASRFLAQNHYTFPVYFDEDRSAYRAYRVNSIPQTYFIGADGVIEAQAVGALNAANVEKGIQMIL